MTRIFTPPTNSEFHEFYQQYISLAPAGNVAQLLESQPESLERLLGDLSNDAVSCLHEPYTWTLKQVVGHLIDGERAFSDRMFRIAVGDVTPISGIDQRMMVSGVDYGPLLMSDLLEEFRSLRRATCLAAHRLSEGALGRMGTASDNPVSARANLYILVGHVEYHIAIIRKRLA